MKSTWPPPQVIFVGLELNQHGQAASQEQASSSWPVIFHGVLSFDSFAARRGDPSKRRPVTSAQGKRDVVFIGRHFTARRSPDKSILSCGRAVAVALRATRCLAGLHISAALRTAKRLQEKPAGDEARTRDVLLGKEVLYH